MRPLDAYRRSSWVKLSVTFLTLDLMGILSLDDEYSDSVISLMVLVVPLDLTGELSCDVLPGLGGTGGQEGGACGGCGGGDGGGRGGGDGGGKYVEETQTSSSSIVPLVPQRSLEHVLPLPVRQW